MSHAEGAHRHVEISPETQQKLSAKDLAIASDDICNACVDMDCSSTQVCVNPDCSTSPSVYWSTQVGLGYLAQLRIKCSYSQVCALYVITECRYLTLGGTTRFIE